MRKHLPEQNMTREGCLILRDKGFEVLKKERCDSMNWLVIAVIVLIVLATLAGAKRGLVKTVLSFASFFVSLVIMLFVREPVSDFVKRPDRDLCSNRD